MKLLSGIIYFEEKDGLPYVVSFPNGAPLQYCYNICMTIADDLKKKLEEADKQKQAQTEQE